MVVFGTVSKVNYKQGMVDIAIKDQEDMIIPDVPYLKSPYGMPEKDDYVCAVFQNKGNNKFSHGVCLGDFYGDEDGPEMYGKNVVYIEFPDGTYIHYDPDSKLLETNAEKVKAKDLTVENLTATNIKVNDVTADNITTAGMTANDIVYHSSCVKG